MIPVIDLNHPNHDELVRACSEWGFFFLRNHSIPDALIDAALEHSRRFFSQSKAVKNRIRRSDTNMWGYYDEELTKNRRDCKEILDIGPAVERGPLAGSHPQWPTDPAYRENLELLIHHLHADALTVTRAIVGTLTADQPDFGAVFGEHSSFLRVNYYPLSEHPAAEDADTHSPQGQLGIHHHTDAGAVTLLVQDGNSGLQVLREQKWHTLPAPEQHIVVNIGDIVQVWSNDRYRAPLHRVLASQAIPRLSLPYFLNPAYDYDYVPLTSGAPRYRPINWGEFRARRSAGDYANLGEEVQISDYAC